MNVEVETHTASRENLKSYPENYSNAKVSTKIVRR